MDGGGHSCSYGVDGDGHSCSYELVGMVMDTAVATGWGDGGGHSDVHIGL